MGASEQKMEAESNVRKLAGLLLGAGVALQFYFFQEMLAALALFAIGFAAVALVMVGLYGLQKGWETAVKRIFGFDQVAARSLPVRDLGLNGQSVARSRLSQELKTRSRNSKDCRRRAAVNSGVRQKCAERIFGLACVTTHTRRTRASSTIT